MMVMNHKPGVVRTGGASCGAADDGHDKSLLVRAETIAHDPSASRVAVVDGNDKAT